MFPIRVSLATYNLWKNAYWSRRKAAIQQFLQLYAPDILCLQELSTESVTLLDATLSQHDRVHDDFPGWCDEGNIYWNDRLLEMTDYGAADVGLEKNRRLFWVRLKVRDRSRSLLVSTAHLTYKGDAHEAATGLSPRIRQSQEIVNALQDLVHVDEPAFFMGDLNDTSHPIFILHDAGYATCFSSLGVPPPPTAPCYPKLDANLNEPTLSQTLDWIVGNKHTRAIAAQAPNFYVNGVSPSDHWPVIAVYEI